MIEAFFQERFNKNIKFYENKTEIELQRNYEHLYNDIELKDIFLAELKIIKKLIINEKETKNNSPINFDDYIRVIDELYNQIEKMNASEIQQQKNNIELIITASKLSLNSPTYFKVDIEKLKGIDLNRKLNEFINRTNISKEDKTLLQQFKRKMDVEIEKKANVIKTKNEILSSLQKKHDELEELYWQMNNGKIDLFDFIGRCSSIDLLTKEEKIICLNKITEIIKNNTSENIQALNDIISQISYRVHAKMNYIKTDKLNYEHYSSMIKSISQCIDENGRFIQNISNELIDECVKQIGYSGFNQIDLQLQILKEQSRIAKKQNIEQIVRIIETRTKTLARKTKVQNNKVQKTNDIVELPKEYDEILKNAKTIIDFELKSQDQNEDMQLDELEAMFVEELQNENVDKNKMDQIIIRDANNDDCRLKFIVYGLNYQLENLNQTNMKNAIELIGQYVNYYKEYKTKKMHDAEQQVKLTDEINEIEKEIENIVSFYQTDENLFDNIPEESLQYLNAYINVDFDEMNSSQIDGVLNDIGYDYEFVVSYKSYKMLNNTIEDLKILLDIAKEEKITEKDIKMIREKFSLIQELKKQYDKSKQLLNENKQSESKPLHPNKEEENNILLFLENSEGKTQAETRVIEDISKFGKYSQTDIGVLQELIKNIKMKPSDYIKTESDNLVEEKDTQTGKKYKVRRLKKGNFRLAFLRVNSSSLKTDKPVYLIISIGKKMSTESGVYDDAFKLKGEVLNFISEYEKLENAPESVIQEFLEKQKNNEEKIIQCAINGKEELDVKKR